MQISVLREIQHIIHVGPEPRGSPVYLVPLTMQRTLWPTAYVHTMVVTVDWRTDLSVVFDLQICPPCLFEPTSIIAVKTLRSPPFCGVRPGLRSHVSILLNYQNLCDYDG